MKKGRNCSEIVEMNIFTSLTKKLLVSNSLQYTIYWIYNFKLQDLRVTGKYNKLHHKLYDASEEKGGLSYKLQTHKNRQISN